MIRKLYISKEGIQKPALMDLKKEETISTNLLCYYLSRNYLSRYMVRECRSVVNRSDQICLHVVILGCFVFNVYEFQAKKF